MAEAEGSQPEPVNAAPSFECPICGRSFPTQQGLSMHTTRTHKPRPDGQGTAARELVWKAGKPEAAFVPADTPQQNLAEALEEIARPNYLDAVEAFLPLLAEEIRERGEQDVNDAELIKAFFLLFNDAQALK